LQVNRPEFAHPIQCQLSGSVKLSRRPPFRTRATFCSAIQLTAGRGSKEAIVLRNFQLNDPPSQSLRSLGTHLARSTWDPSIPTRSSTPHSFHACSQAPCPHPTSSTDCGFITDDRTPSHHAGRMACMIKVVKKRRTIHCVAVNRLARFTTFA
jgi:hypothetical protein